MEKAVKLLALSRPGMPASLLAVTLVLAGVGLLAHSILLAQPRQKAAEPPPPMPEARVRLGTSQFRHAGWVRDVTFLAGGKSVLTSSYDGSVRRWEADSGKEIRRFPGIGFSLTADGKAMATWHRNGEVTLWDLTTGKPLRQWRAQPQTHCMAISPDGKFLASGGNSPDNPKPIALWDVSTGKELPAPPHLRGSKSSFAGRLLFSPDSTILAAANEFGGPIQLWEVATAKEITPARRPREGSTGMHPVPFTFSPDGRLIASAGEIDPAVRLWEVATGKERYCLKGGHCDSVAFSPDGRLLASGHANGLIRLWDTGTGKERGSWQGHAGRLWHEEGIACLAFSADGKVLVSGGTDRIVRLWDVATRKALHPSPGHQGAVTALSVSSDGKTVVSAGMDKTIRLWDLSAGKELGPLPWDKGLVDGLAGSPDGKFLVSQSSTHAGERLHLWDMTGGKQLHQFLGVKTTSRALAFSPDGRALACSQKYGICLLDVATGKERYRTPKVQLYAAFVAFSPDGKTFAWCGHDDDGRVTFHVADAVTGKEVRRIDNEVLCQLEDRDSRFDHVSTIGGSIGFSAFTPDGKALLFGLNEQVFLWSLDPRRKLLRFGTDTPLRVRAAALSSDGKTLATGNKDGTVCLWEVATMKQRVRFQAHEGAGREGNMGGVASLAWSRDGNVLVSGGEDTSILVWDVTTLMGQGRSRPADLTPRELEGLWGDLAGEEAGKAYRAIGRLITSPRTAGGFLGKQLHPATDLRGIARLIRDLDDDRSPVRENATRELEGLGRSAESALRQALAGKPSLEVRRRLERLLERFEERALTPQELRSVRAIEVLERLGTSEARDVLRGLARGAPPAYVTREAKAALERLARG